ncbi:TPA: RNase AM [Citrobacter sedlakii]
MSDTNYAVIYDLHSHTTASDGRLTPEELVHRAVEMRVGTLAITDHDTTAAIPAASEEISRSALPLTLIPGVEISTLWENHEIHIVGLNIDIAHPAMRAFLAEQTERRQQRAKRIAERLEKAHIPGAWEGALRLADGGAVTRGHFARFLVECGKATTMADVFKKYLARGKTGYVPPQWCTIEQAIDVIHHSGGKAVLAHPGRYNLSAKWLKRLVAHFADHRGDAMEVAQCQQSPNERTQLATLARQHQLWASQGSDFHQPCPWIELGRKLWLPAGVEGVWQLWE